MDACQFWSLPWPYFAAVVIIGFVNQHYLDRTAKPEDGLWGRLRVGLDILFGKYDRDRWPRFVRRFVFASFLAFPVFAVGWWLLAQKTFPACQ